MGSGISISQVLQELFISTNVGDIHVYANPKLKSEEGWAQKLLFVKVLNLEMERIY